MLSVAANFEPLLATDSRRTWGLELEVPALCEDGGAAAAKWLLALWQSARKPTWRFWRHRAAIALELWADNDRVSHRLRFSRSFLAEISLSILPTLFPGCEVNPISNSPTDYLSSQKAATAIFQFRSPGWVELPKDEGPEGVDGVIGAMHHLRPREHALVQLLLEPTWMTTEDGRQPAFWFAGRIAAAASTGYARSARLVQVLASAYGQFAGFNGLRFSRTRAMSIAALRSMDDLSWPHRLVPPEPPAIPAQIATLYHPPAAADPFERLLSVRYRRTPSVGAAKGVLMGEGRDGSGRPASVRVHAADLTRHAFVLGPSGSGKSTFLAHLALELVRAGHGVTVIDPHGSLVRSIARGFSQERESDASLLRFADRDYPISLNPLRAQPSQEALAADELVEIVQRVYGREYWGPLLDLTLRHAAIASIELGGSLIESARLLDDPWFRTRALERLENVETTRFLRQLGEGGVYDRRSLPAVHRLQRLLATPWLRNMLGQPTAGIEFAEIFDRRQTLLLDLSGLGTSNARLIGSLILLMIRQATLSRRPDSFDTRARHFVLVDEASWFISRTVAELFDQARKFGIGLVLATQRLGQLTPEDAREAVLANSGTLVVFRTSDREEATFFSRHFASGRVSPADLQHLPRYEAYVQLTHDGDRHEPAWIRTPLPPAERRDAYHVESRLVAAGRARYARPRAAVEQELDERERKLIQDEEPEVRSVEDVAAVPAYTARPAHT
jgi:energy-coupling factor transporter ATP-binding protein EcfA2